jgi:hypothetical protein
MNLLTRFLGKIFDNLRDRNADSFMNGMRKREYPKDLTDSIEKNRKEREALSKSEEKYAESQRDLNKRSGKKGFKYLNAADDDPDTRSDRVDHNIKVFEMKKNLIDKKLEKFNKFKENIKLGLNISEIKKIGPGIDKKVTNVSRGKEITKLYFGKFVNRLGNDSFEFEVTLKEGKVTGWKDGTDVGTAYSYQLNLLEEEKRSFE